MMTLFQPYFPFFSISPSFSLLFVIFFAFFFLISSFSIIGSMYQFSAHMFSVFSPFLSPNSERERMEKEVKTKTVSLWSLILSNPSDFENPLYNPATRHHVLFPLTSMRHLCLWDKYYCRWNPSMRPQVLDDVFFFVMPSGLYIRATSWTQTYKYTHAKTRYKNK